MSVEDAVPEIDELLNNLDNIQQDLSEIKGLIVELIQFFFANNKKENEKVFVHRKHKRYARRVHQHPSTYEGYQWCLRLPDRHR